jgi:hypothetical protein
MLGNNRPRKNLGYATPNEVFLSGYNVMKNNLLFEVDDHFQISWGLVITPGIPLKDYEGSRYTNLLLKRPNGSQVIEKAEIFYSFPVPTPDKKILTVLFKHLKKDDVPIGTEVWFNNDEN